MCLVPHPALQSVCLVWAEDKDAVKTAAAAAAAEQAVPEGAANYFAAVRPVLSRVSTLHMFQWPCSCTLPDMSGLTAVTSLVFCFEQSRARRASHVQPVDIVSPVSPLVALQSLDLCAVPRLSAQAVVPLQYMLPQLQHVRVSSMEVYVRLWSGAGASDLHRQEPHEVEVLRNVRQLLRPGFELKVDKWLGWCVAGPATVSIGTTAPQCSCWQEM
jgi:hypothetical protein